MHVGCGIQASMKYSAIVIALTSIGLFGCGSSPIEELYTLTDDNVDLACECWSELGFADRNECISENGVPVTPTELACLEETYAQNQATLRSQVSCSLDETHVLNRCLSAVSECNTASIGRCIDEARRSFESCPRAPESVRESLNACISR